MPIKALKGHLLTCSAKDTDPFTPRPEEGTLQAQIQELMCYIWDNYLQLYDSVEDIFLMGVGNAYLGIKVLLINRRKSPRSQVFPSCNHPHLD